MEQFQQLCEQLKEASGDGSFDCTEGQCFGFITVTDSVIRLSPKMSSPERSFYEVIGYRVKIL